MYTTLPNTDGIFYRFVTLFAEAHDRSVQKEPNCNEPEKQKVRHTLRGMGFLDQT
jgi:hypothetical protein